VHVEAVCGAVGCAELLSAALLLQGVGLYGGSLAAAGGSRTLDSLVRLLAALALVLAAALSKETGLTGLGVCAALEWLDWASAGLLTAEEPEPAKSAPPSPAAAPPLGRKAAARLAAAGRAVALPPPPRDSLRPLRCAGLVAAAAIYLAVRREVLAGSMVVFAWRVVDNHIPFISNPTARTLTTLHMHWRYLLLLAWPQELCADWNYACVPTVQSAGDARNAGALLLYALLAAIALHSRFWDRQSVGSVASPSRAASRTRLVSIAALCAAPLLPPTCCSTSAPTWRSGCCTCPPSASAWL
jgi:Domain of unknown function (DUF1736)